MLVRCLLLVLIVAVPACTQPLPPLPSYGAPTQEAVSMAQATCPDATFTSAVPYHDNAYWFHC